MIVQCDKCNRNFDVPEAALLPDGRKLKCAGCGHVFFQAMPGREPPPPPEETPEEIDGEDGEDRKDEEKSSPDKEADEEAPPPIHEEASSPNKETDEETPPSVEIAPEIDEALLEIINQEDEATGSPKTEAGEWTTHPDDLKEIDIDNDPDLADSASFPDDTAQEPGSEEDFLKSSAIQSESTFTPQDEADEDEDEWATSFNDLATIDVDSDPELRELKAMSQTSDTNDSMGEEDLWPEEEDPWPSEEDTIEEEPLLPKKTPEPDFQSDPPKEEPQKEAVIPVVLPIPTKDRSDEETPVATEAKQDQGQKSSKIAWALVALLLLTLSLGQVTQTEWWKSKTFTEEENLLAPSSLPPVYQLLPIEGHWQKHSFGTLLVLRGKVGDRNHTAITPPMIEIFIEDKENNTLRSTQVVPGRVVDEAVIKKSREEAIRKIISIQSKKRTRAESEMRFEKDIPFQAMFINPPEEAAHFRVNFK